MKKFLARALLYKVVFFAVCADVLGVQQVTNPRIVEHPTDTFIAKNEPATINCKVEGEPRPIVTWYHNGEMITESIDDKKKLNKMVLPTGQLFFMGFQKDANAKQDVGIYYCNATNPETRVSVVSRNATVALASIGNEFRNQPKSRDVRIGWPLYLNCSPPKGNPEPSVKWKKNNEVLNATDRIKILPNSTLFINETRKEDNGIYFCVAYNSAGERSSMSARVLVKEKPRIIEGPKDVLAHEGSEVKFQCRAIGDPNPIIIWKKAEGPLPTKRMFLMDEKNLKIEKLKDSDEGVYICRAENSFGYVEAEAKLTVYSPPSFLATPMGRIVGIGRKVIFRCEVTGSPMPTLFWNKEGNATLMFPGRNYGRMVVTDDGSLVIDPVLREDTGEYICKALSLAGSAYAKAKLEVREEDTHLPPIIDTMPYNQTVSRGSNAELKCTAVGQPPPIIRWTKNGKSISPSRENRMKLLSSGVLTITGLLKTDSGQYSCKALSESGETMRSAYLTVEYPTNPRVVFQDPDRKRVFPRVPSKPDVEEVSDTSIHISWKHENQQGAPSVTSYSVEYFSHDTGEGWVMLNTNSSEKNFVISGLRPDTPYIFFVRSQNSDGFSGPSPLTPPIKTKAPSRPMNASKLLVSSHYSAVVSEKLSAQVINILPLEVLSSTSIKVSWELRKGTMKYLEGFKVCYRLVSDHEMRQRSQNLGLNKQSSKLKHKINRDARHNKARDDVYKQNYEFHLISKRHLKHHITPATLHDSIYGDLVENKSEFEQKAPQTYSLYDYMIDTIQNNAASTHTLKNLEKFSFYEIYVQPFYDHIVGKPSQSIRARTFEDVPSSPPINIQVKLIDNDTLHITWDAPPRRLCHGILRGYKIYMFGSEPKYNREIAINSSLDGVYIHNIIKDMLYGIQLSAFTKAGEGSKSETFFVGNQTSGRQKQTIMSETWFIVTIVAIFGGIFWLVLCFFSTWLYRNRRNNKKISYKLNGKGPINDYIRTDGFGALDSKTKNVSIKQQIVQKGDSDVRENCDNIINDSLFSRSSLVASPTSHLYCLPQERTDLNLDNFIISTNKTGIAAGTLKKLHNYPAVLYIPPPPEHPPPSPPSFAQNPIPSSKGRKHSMTNSRAKKKKVKDSHNYNIIVSSTLSQHQSKSNGVIPDRVKEDFGGMVRVWSPHAMSEPECCGGQQQQLLNWSDNKTAVSSDMLVGGRHFSDNEVNPSYQICHEYSPPSPAPEEPINKKKLLQPRLLQLKQDFRHTIPSQGLASHDPNLSSSSSDNVLHQTIGPDDDQFLTWNERGTQDSDTNCSSIPSSIASSDISFREKVELLNAVTKAMQATTQPLRKDSIN